MQLSKFVNEILLIFIILLIVGGYGLYFYQNYYVNEEITTNNEIISEVHEITPDNNITVEVKGEVNNPGVYEMSSNDRINDVINKAGGFTANSYTNNINLSKKLSDELVIYVYTKYENYLLEQEKVKIIYKESECNCPSYDITTCIDNATSIINAQDDLLENSEEKLININTASLEELTTLTGIGEAKAQMIIEYRNEYGNFKTIEDIKNVSGISDTTYEKIKNNITV